VNVGDLVRYRQGSLDMTGIVLKRESFGDFVAYLVLWSKECYTGKRKQLCRAWNLELISESR
jgi:hypothetical protein